jgi:NADPH2:quinone reductase
MRAARCTEHGRPEAITVEDRPEPEPGPGRVLVRVHAAAVNFPDVLIVADRYQASSPVPFTPGSEFAGVVTALGDGASGPAVGTPVMGTVFTGAFAEHVVVRAADLRPVPDGLDMTSAAAFGITYNSAFHAVRTIGDGSPGDWVVVLGAAGGVGTATVDVATRLGMRVIAVASSPERLAVAAARGAEAGIDYVQEDLREGIRRITRGAGAAYDVDPVGGAHAEAALRGLRWGGRFVTVGFADGEIPRIPLNLVLLKGVIVRGFQGPGIRTHLPEAVVDAERVLAGLVAEGMRPLVSRVYPLEEAGSALTAVADRRTTGKVVLEMAPG